jgi:hypothetical protein
MSPELKVPIGWARWKKKIDQKRNEFAIFGKELNKDIGEFNAGRQATKYKIFAYWVATVIAFYTALRCGKYFWHKWSSSRSQIENDNSNLENDTQCYTEH